MPTPTQQNAERINQLTELFNALSGKVDRLAETTGTDAKKFQDAVDDIREVVETLREAVVAGSVTDARHDERLKALEKSTEDRLSAMEKAAEKSSERPWKLAPILLSAGSMVIALVSAVVAIVVVSKK